jgi:tripartite-type tricarboxylate transporter receptor subunit TctC
MGGRINLFVDNVLTSLPLIREDKIRALAVTTERRVAALPEVPSMAELGLPSVTVSSWQVVIAPARLPDAVTARLGEELDRAIRAPAMVAWMNSLAAVPAGGGHEAAQAMVARERARWARDIPPLNIRLD